MLLGHCWYSDMILRYCPSSLISAAIFQSFTPFKIYQCCGIFVLNDALSPSLMTLTILWYRLRDTAALFQATFIISTRWSSTLLWHHFYLPLLITMEHNDMTCASVPGFSHNKHFQSLDSPHHARTALVGSWSYVAHMACISHTPDTHAIYLTTSPITMWLLLTWSRFPVVTAEQQLPSTFLPQGFVSALLPAAFFGDYWPLTTMVFPWVGIQYNVGGSVLHPLPTSFFLLQVLCLLLPLLSTLCLCLF